MRQNNKMTCSFKKKEKKKQGYVLSWKDVLCGVWCGMTHMLLLQRREGYISPWVGMQASGYEGANEVAGRETGLRKKGVICFKQWFVTQSFKGVL